MYRFSSERKLTTDYSLCGGIDDAISYQEDEFQSINICFPFTLHFQREKKTSKLICALSIITRFLLFKSCSIRLFRDLFFLQPAQSKSLLCFFFLAWIELEISGSRRYFFQFYHQYEFQHDQTQQISKCPKQTKITKNKKYTKKVQKNMSKKVYEANVSSYFRLANEP